MAPQLPRHLKDLVDELPKNSKYYDQIHLRGNRLVEWKPEKGAAGQLRKYQYWHAGSGDEITEFKFYPTDDKNNKTGILTGTLGHGIGTVILGRAPEWRHSHCRVWRGVDEGFVQDNNGAYDKWDSTYLVVKWAGEPHWVNKVRQGEKYRDVVHSRNWHWGKQTDSAQADGNNDDDDESDSNVGDIPYEVPDAEVVNTLVSADAAAAAPQAPPPAKLTRGGTGRSPGMSRSASSKEPATSSEDDASDDHIRPSSAGIESSKLYDLLVHFRAAKPDTEPRSRPWGIFKTLSELFESAILGGVFNRADGLKPMWVVVKTGGKDVRGSPFGITKTDTGTFEALGSALERIARSGGLKRTTVEVIQDES